MPHDPLDDLPQSEAEWIATKALIRYRDGHGREALADFIGRAHHALCHRGPAMRSYQRCARAVGEEVGRIESLLASELAAQAAEVRRRIAEFEWAMYARCRAALQR